MVYIGAGFPSEWEGGVGEIPYQPFQPKELGARWVEANVVVTAFVIKRRLEVAFVDITSEVCEIIQFKRAIFCPAIKEALVVAHARLGRFDCDWHHQIRRVADPNLSYYVKRSVGDSLHDGLRNETLERLA